MEKYAWSAKIKEGKKEEYVRRHDEIWPELVKVLKDAGICNYTIWTDGSTLFGYYECEKGIDFAAKAQANSPCETGMPSQAETCPSLRSSAP